MHMASTTIPVNTVLRTVSGMFLAHSKRTKVESAFLARDLHFGNTQLTFPTIGQSAVLADVSPSYVRAAINTPANLQKLVETGVVSLVSPALTARTKPASAQPVTPVALAAQLIDATGGLDQALDVLLEVNG